MAASGQLRRLDLPACWRATGQTCRATALPGHAMTRELPERAVIKALLGLALLAFILGSLHAFSVLLLPMETEFDVSRGAASMTYSIALIALAAAVLTGYKLYTRIAPPAYVVMTGTLAAAGCVLAALSPSTALVWLGFGLIFGAANGLGYGYALQFSGRAVPERKGFAMGIITAAYALGAVIFPVPLRIAIETGGWVTALLFLAVCLLLFSVLSALTLSRAGITYGANAEPPGRIARGTGKQIAWLWLSYCGAVTAGLMAIGQATGLAASVGSGTFWIVAAPIAVASANMIGSLLAGILVDRMGGRSVLSFLALISAVALLTMAIASHLTTTMIGLAIIGFAYGGTIVAYPAYISERYGAITGTVVYARVFTAWAAAGLLGPAGAGLLFDRYGNYWLALMLAAVAAAGSLVLLKVKIRG